MQIAKKPKIDPVLKACAHADRQEIEQKERYTDLLKIHSCLKEFETANFKTRNPEMKFFVQSSASTLSGNTCNVEEPGLNFLQAAEKNSSNFNLDLNETGLQAVTGAAECFSCPLAPKTEN